jgi:hypothetical protein
MTAVKFKGIISKLEIHLITDEEASNYPRKYEIPA